MEEAIAGVVLAGGQARRMGGNDKVLAEVGGESLLARVCGRLGPQVARLAVAAGTRRDLPVNAGLAVFDDGAFAGAGPLAGVLAGLAWARGLGMTRVVTVPADAPFVPGDLVVRLGTGLAFAASGGRTHWTAGAWPVALEAELRRFLAAGGDRSVRAFARSAGWRSVVFEVPEGGPDPFFNVNTPADLAAGRTFVSSEAAASPQGTAGPRS